MSSSPVNHQIVHLSMADGFFGSARKESADELVRTGHAEVIDKIRMNQLAADLVAKNPRPTSPPPDALIQHDLNTGDFSTTQQVQDLSVEHFFPSRSNSPVSARGERSEEFVQVAKAEHSPVTAGKVLDLETAFPQETVNPRPTSPLINGLIQQAEEAIKGQYDDSFLAVLFEDAFPSDIAELITYFAKRKCLAMYQDFWNCLVETTVNKAIENQDPRKFKQLVSRLQSSKSHEAKEFADYLLDIAPVAPSPVSPNMVQVQDAQIPVIDLQAFFPSRPSTPTSPRGEEEAPPSLKELALSTISSGTQGYFFLAHTLPEHFCFPDLAVDHLFAKTLSTFFGKKPSIQNLLCWLKEESIPDLIQRLSRETHCFASIEEDRMVLPVLQEVISQNKSLQWTHAFIPGVPFDFPALDAFFENEDTASDELRTLTDQLYQAGSLKYSPSHFLTLIERSRNQGLKIVGTETPLSQELDSRMKGGFIEDRQHLYLAKDLLVTEIIDQVKPGPRFAVFVESDVSETLTTKEGDRGLSRLLNCPVVFIE